MARWRKRSWLLKKTPAPPAPAPETPLNPDPPNEISDVYPHGELGAPLQRHSPFYIGFFGALGALLAVWLGQQVEAVSSALILVMVAAFLAVGLNPAVEWFMSHGLRKRTWAVSAVTVIVLTAVGMFIVAIVPVLSDQVARIITNAPDWLNQLAHNPQVERLDAKYDLIVHAQEYISSGGYMSAVFGGILGFGVAVLSAVFNGFILMVLTLYFMASLPQTKNALYRLAPASRRTRVASLGDQILTNVSSYVSGAFLVATAAGLTSLGFLFIVGLEEYAVALAFVVALLDVIPMIGATLGATVVVAIGFATDPKIGVACLVFYLAYQQLENYLIYPRVMSRSVDIPGAVIVIAALIGAGLLGVVGALVAVPTAAAILLLTREIFVRRQDER